MSRLFEFRSQEVDGDVLHLIDLDKVCLVRVEKHAGQHYPRILVRFLDGHETHEMVRPEAAQQFLDAYRAYLKGSSGHAG